MPHPSQRIRAQASAGAACSGDCLCTPTLKSDVIHVTNSCSAAALSMFVLVVFKNKLREGYIKCISKCNTYVHTIVLNNNFIHSFIQILKNNESGVVESVQATRHS